MRMRMMMMMMMVIATSGSQFMAKLWWVSQPIALSTPQGIFSAGFEEILLAGDTNRLVAELTFASWPSSSWPGTAGCVFFKVFE
jgi:hypothetical protein